MTPPALRIWDAIDDDLVERAVQGRAAASKCLPGFWVVVPSDKTEWMLRLSRDPAGEQLYPTPAEHHAALARAESVARLEAEVRVRELEAELAGRK